MVPLCPSLVGGRLSMKLQKVLILQAVIFLSTICFGITTPYALAANPTSIYDLKLKELDGKTLDLSTLKGSVILVVNTASKCGFTPQYKDLQGLYEKYKDKGLVVLGFPSNDFGGQEPGTDQEIKKFCALKYGVTFPVFKKGVVTGPEKQEVYRLISEQAPKDMQGEVEWNFEKFLIDREGHVKARFGSYINPLSKKVTSQIEEALDNHG